MVSKASGFSNAASSLVKAPVGSAPIRAMRRSERRERLGGGRSPSSSNGHGAPLDHVDHEVRDAPMVHGVGEGPIARHQAGHSSPKFSLGSGDVRVVSVIRGLLDERVRFCDGVIIASRRRRGTPRATIHSAPRGVSASGGPDASTKGRRGSSSTATTVPGHVLSISPTASTEAAEVVGGFVEHEEIRAPADDVGQAQLGSLSTDSDAGNCSAVAPVSSNDPAEPGASDAVRSTLSWCQSAERRDRVVRAPRRSIPVRRCARPPPHPPRVPGRRQASQQAVFARRCVRSPPPGHRAPRRSDVEETFFAP